MDESLIKYQHDKKLKALEKQVEYFRSQALRLKSEREGTLRLPEFVQQIDTLKEKLDACQLEKKYFETFMIESRKENKDLKDQIQKGDKQIIEKIKQIAKQEAVNIRKETERERIVSFQPERNSMIADSPLLIKHISDKGELPKHSIKYFASGFQESGSKILNTNLDL